MVNSSIRDWLENDRRPGNLYELLGRAAFDPDTPALMAAIRSAYAQLLPYENHRDRRIADRATELLRELGRAEDILSDPGKLKAHHELVLSRLREDWALACDKKSQSAEREQLRAWLGRRGVHPKYLRVVAESMAAAGDETVDWQAPESELGPQSSSQTRTAFILQDEESDTLSESSWAETDPGGVEAASLPVLAEVVSEPEYPPGGIPDRPEARRDGPLPERPRLKKESKRRKPAKRPKPSSRSAVERGADKRARQLYWVLGTAVGIWLVFVGLLWLAFGTTDTWRGRLMRVRGHDGEIHLLVDLDSDSASGAIRSIDAFVADPDFGREIGDYLAAEEPDSEGDRVVVEGSLANASQARFTLGNAAVTAEVKLTAIQIDGQPRTRAEVGKRRRAFLAKRSRSALGELIRIHPKSGLSTGFYARYLGTAPGGIEVVPALTDRRSVLVRFAGSSSGDFALYQPEDEVYVVAELAQDATADRLVLEGRQVRRLQEPNAPVAASGGL